MSTLNNTRGKGRPMDYVVEKGTFLMLGVVVILGTRDSWLSEMLVALWLVWMD